MKIVVLDFDNTLFCTDYNNLMKNVNFAQRWNYDDDIIRLSESVNNIIETFVNIGKVYIITNATESWVDLVLNTFIPRCKPLFEKVDLISTVDKGYSDISDIKQWKYKPFEEIIENNENVTHIISLGDQHSDRDSCIRLRKQYENLIIKNVLLMRQPTIKDLLLQHNLIINYIDLFKNDEKMDLSMQKNFINTDNTPSIPSTPSIQSDSLPLLPLLNKANSYPNLHEICTEV